MSNKFFQYLKESDEFLLQTVMLLCLLILIIMLFSGPCYMTAKPPQPETEVDIQPTVPKPPQLQPTPQALFLVEKPSFPAATPTSTVTPVPTPTPTGGGFHKIAFASNRATGRYLQLYMMDSDGTHIERLTESMAFDRDPHISHDGNSIAFASNRNGATYQIYRLDLATRAVRQITFAQEDITNPIWSNNDRQILFTIHRGHASEIGIMNADGKNFTLLTRTRGNNHGYSFSHTDQHVAYETSINDRSEIFIMELSTRKSSLLIQSDELSFRGDPVFSPVANKLVFTSNVLDAKIRQLYIYDANSQHYYRMKQDPLDKDDPAFSPDGTQVAFIASWESAWNIFIMDVDGSNLKNLTKSYYDNIVPTWR